MTGVNQPEHNMNPLNCYQLLTQVRSSGSSAEFQCAGREVRQEDGHRLDQELDSMSSQARPDVIREAELVIDQDFQVSLHPVRGETGGSGCTWC